MTEKKHTTTTTTEETIQTQTQTSEGLSPTEEKVVRMLHGLTEDGSAKLEFALGANEEAIAQLALMENHLLNVFGRTDKTEPEHLDAKARIIDALKG